MFLWQVIYGKKSYQMKLFNNIVNFDKTIKTILDKKKALILFLDENTYFYYTHYINIWFKLAHEHHSSLYLKNM